MLINLYLNQSYLEVLHSPQFILSYLSVVSLQVLWTREIPDTGDQTGRWRQVKVDVAPGSYKFSFASFYRSESDLADKAIDDILIEEGDCGSLPGRCQFRIILCQTIILCQIILCQIILSRTNGVVELQLLKTQSIIVNIPSHCIGNLCNHKPCTTKIVSDHILPCEIYVV